MSNTATSKQASGPIPPSSLMSYFDSSRTATPKTTSLTRNVAPAQSGVCAHDAVMPVHESQQQPQQQQQQPQQPAQARSRSDSIASSYKQYFAQKTQHGLAASEASITRSASMTSSMRGAAYPAAQQQQRAAPYPHEPSKPVRESATMRQAAPTRPAAANPAANAYPVESEEWERAEEPVMREESPLDTQAAAEPMMAPPPRNAYNPNTAPRAQPQAPRTQSAAAPVYAPSTDSSRRSPYTPREFAAAPASAPRAEGTPIRRGAPANTNAASTDGVALPEYSNSYMEPGTPRSDRETPRRKSDARRLNPRSNSYDPVYTANTPRSDEDEDYISDRAQPHYPAYESLGAARPTPSAAAQPAYARPQPTYDAPAYQQPTPAAQRPAYSAPQQQSRAAPMPVAGAEDTRQQYPSQYRSLYRPDVRAKREEGAPNFPFNRSESSVVADSTTTSERGYRPPFDLSPKRPEDYVADDMEFDDEEANCTFQPNLDRRQPRSRSVGQEGGEDVGEAEAPVFSRLYADAQRVNRVREERERALELQRQMRRGEIPYDAEALRAAGLPVNEMDETELAVGASRRPTLCLGDDKASHDAGEDEEDDEDGIPAEHKRRRSSMARKKVDFEVFERLSKPQAVTPKYQRALEMKQEAEKEEERRREEARKDAFDNIGKYEWPLPAKSFKMADLRQQNSVFVK